MATVKRYTYEFDPTGRLAANLITNELHTITAENRTPQNVLIPGFAPFFRQSLIVTDIVTGNPLLEGIDYTCEWPVISASENANTEAYTPIYGGIQFIDNNITGQFRLQYQTIGGQYALDGVRIAQALANQANDPLITKYEDIIGKPLTFPPLEHVHSIEDFVGFEDLCLEIIKLKEAIELLAREDRENHPGYDTLVDAYFRLEQRLEAHIETINNLDAEFRRTIQVIRDNIAEQLEQMRQTMTTALSNQQKDYDAKIKAAKDQLTAQLTALQRTIEQQIKTQLDALKARLDGNEFVKTTTNQTVNGEKTFTEAITAKGVKLTPKTSTTQTTGKVGEVYFDGTGLHLIDPISGKDLNVKSDGKVYHDNKQLAYLIDVNTLDAKVERYHRGERANGNAATVELLNKFGDDMPLGQLYGSATNDAEFIETMKLGGLVEPSASSYDYTAFNFGSTDQVTQLFSTGNNSHYIRTNDGAGGNGWHSELLLTSGTFAAWANKQQNIVLTTTNQTVDGIKAFKKDIDLINTASTTETPIANAKIRHDTNGLAFYASQANKWLRLSRDGNAYWGTSKLVETKSNNVTDVGHTLNLINGTNIKGTVAQSSNGIMWFQSTNNSTGAEVRNFRYELPNTGKSDISHILTSDGTYFTGAGQWVGQKTTSAPYMIYKSSAHTSEHYKRNGSTSFFPMIKARISNSLTAEDHNAKKSTYTLGFVPSGTGNGYSKGVFALHYVEDDQPDNTFSDKMMSFQFHLNDTGLISSTAGRYNIGRDVSGDRWRVIYNNGASGATDKWFALHGNGDVRTHHGYVVHFSDNYIRSINASAATSWTGIALSQDNQIFKYEVDGVNKTFKLKRDPKTGGKGALDIVFQDKSGTVALMSDVDALRTTLATKYVTLDTAQSITGAKTFTQYVNFSTNGYRIGKVSNLNELEIVVNTTSNISLRLNGDNANNTYMWTNAHKITFNQGYAKFGNGMLHVGDAGNVRLGFDSGVLVHYAGSAQNAHIRLVNDGYADFHSNNNAGIRLNGDNACRIYRGTQDGRVSVFMHDVSVNDIYVRSDRRLKENIEPIKDALGTVMKLQGRHFDWKVSGRHATGFIAQEVEQVCRDLVSYSDDENKTMSVSYVDVIAYLVEAVKTQQKQIDELKSKSN